MVMGSVLGGDYSQMSEELLYPELFLPENQSPPTLDPLGQQALEFFQPGLNLWQGLQNDYLSNQQAEQQAFLNQANQWGLTPEPSQNVLGQTFQAFQPALGFVGDALGGFGNIFNVGAMGSPSGLPARGNITPVELVDAFLNRTGDIPYAREAGQGAQDLVEGLTRPLNLPGDVFGELTGVNIPRISEILGQAAEWLVPQTWGQASLELIPSIGIVPDIARGVRGLSDNLARGVLDGLPENIIPFPSAASLPTGPRDIFSPLEARLTPEEIAAQLSDRMAPQGPGSDLLAALQASQRAEGFPESEISKLSQTPAERTVAAGDAQSAWRAEYDRSIKAGFDPDIARARANSASLHPGQQIPIRTEEPITSQLVDERRGIHVLQSANGRLDYRVTPEGGHIMDVVAVQEGRGTGTNLLNKAIDDIRAGNPEAIITADLNSEAGARLFARQEGAEFFTRQGEPLTAAEAAASAARREGPVVEIRPGAKVDNPLSEQVDRAEGIRLGAATPEPRPTTPVSGRFPGEGPLTPAEARAENAARIGRIHGEMPSLRELSDADLINLSVREGVPRTGTPPLDEAGRLNPTYRRGLELDIAENRHPPSGRGIQTIDAQMRQAQQISDFEEGKRFTESTQPRPTDGAGGAGKAPPSGPAPEWGMTGGVPPKGVSIGEVPGKIYRGIIDALYFPFGEDASYILRQDGMRTLNPLYIGETRQVAGDARRGMSPEGFIEINRELSNLPLTKQLGTKVTFAETGSNLVNREVMNPTWADRIPLLGELNRFNATWVNSRRAHAVENFIKDNLNSPNLAAKAQAFAHQIARETGRAKLGPEGVEKVLANTLGPAFTSLRFAASIPERLIDLVPIRLLAEGKLEIGGPAWRDAVKTQGGFVATVAGTMALAEQMGAQVGWNPLRTSETRAGPPFGTIQIGDLKADLLAGARPFVGLIFQLATGEKNFQEYPRFFERGSDGRYRGAAAEFIRNKLGPLPGGAAELAKATGLDERLGLQSEFQFLRPDYWDKGVFGTGSTMDRVAAHVIPLWLQDVADAANYGGLKEALAAAPLGFFGAGAQTYEKSASLQREIELGNILSDPTRLSQFVRDEASARAIAKLAEDENMPIWRNLSSREKYDLTQALDPGLIQAAKQASEEFDPKSAALYEKVDKITEDYGPSFERAYDQLLTGKSDATGLTKAVKQAEKDMNAEKSAIYAQLEKSGQKLSPIQQAENNYRALFSQYTVNGKTDWDRLAPAQSQFIRDLYQKDPDLASRLAYELQPSPNQPQILYELDRLHALPAYQRHFDLPLGTRNQDYLANPQLDALIWFMGEKPDVHSRAAYDYALRLVGDGDRRPVIR